MPFKKDDAKTKEWGKMGGLARERYIIPDKQLDRIKELIGKYVYLSEKEDLTIKEIEQMQRIEKIVLKGIDKLHASKSDIKVDIEKPLLIKDV